MPTELMKDYSPPGSGDGGSTSVCGWYAIQVATGQQFRLREWLRGQGIEEYLPTVPEERRWSDRIKVAERALIPGYVFARFDLAAWRRLVAARPGVIAIAGCGGIPTAIDDAELGLLRRIADQMGQAVSPCPYVAGETVEIAQGPLAGVRGVVQRTRGSVRVIVAIEILRRAVSVEIDAADLEHK